MSKQNPWQECPTVRMDLRNLGDRDRFPPVLVEKAKKLLEGVLADVPNSSRFIADAVRIRTEGRFHKEVSSLSRATGVPWRDLMVANLSYDLVLSIFGCSTIALATPNGPVVARNMDWWPEDLLAQASCLLEYCENDSFCFASAGWIGGVGIVTGLSECGFAVILNAVSGIEGVNATGYPVLLHIRRTIQDAKDFDSALKILSETKLAAPCLLTLVGSDNSQRIVIERTPNRHALRYPKGDEPLITTNHYISLAKQEAHGGGEIYETTCRRYDSLGILLSQFNPGENVDDDRLLAILNDQDVIQSITAQHVIIRPRQQVMRLFVPGRFASK